MQLVRRPLAGRAFLFQFWEIMREFADEIPWLEPVKSIAWSTNPIYFRDKFVKLVGGNELEGVTPLQLTTSDTARNYLGGMLHFATSPERFRDPRNNEKVEQFLAEGYSYITCLQVRDVCRGEGCGDLLMRRALRSILAKHPRVWGVVSNPGLIPWYVHLGACVDSFPDTTDGLTIVTWKRDV